MRTTQRVLLSALVLALSFHGLSSSTLEDLCGLLGDEYVDKVWCIATLSADPRSRTADRRGLGVLATNLTVAKAAVVRTQLEGLVGKATDAVDKNRGEAFLLLYTNMIASLRWSADSISSGFYDGPAAVLAAAQPVPSSNGYISVGRENDEVSELILLSHAIAQRLP